MSGDRETSTASDGMPRQPQRTFSLRTLLAVTAVCCVVFAATALVIKLTPDDPSPYDGYTHSKPEHGYWREREQIVSAGGRRRTSDQPIGELHLHDGGFSVTWMPFETYKDYWGTYTWNRSDNSVRFTIDQGSGNYVPTDFDGAGHMVLQSDGTLLLKGVWLGTPQGATATPGTGHVFERYEPAY